MEGHLHKALAEARRLEPALEQIRFSELLTWLSADPAIAAHTPDQTCQLDPRDGSLVVYNASRSARPHTVANSVSSTPPGNCPICEGAATRVVDVADQSQGFTFISQNLYPILHPSPCLADELLSRPLYPDPQHAGRAAYGLHLLQWTSSLHDHDWHNMAVTDLAVCIERLAVLEEKLVHEAGGYMPPSDMESDTFGCFSVIKNWGGAAGASLSHGHQQIAFSNIMPQRAYNNWTFFRRHQRSFAQYLLSENPEELTVAEWPGWRLVVPYFMQRPLAVMLLPTRSGLRHLHQLSDDERLQLTTALQASIRALLVLLPHYLQPPAYNFVLHSGPGNDLYIEFFPITQANGGFERLGLWICQERPQRSAQKLRQALAELPPVVAPAASTPPAA
ncbi:MAG: hypothetical protein KA754_07050 [Corallincola sp.]|nr:hypothetical protein [Corallincola sp.]